MKAFILTSSSCLELQTGIEEKTNIICGVYASLRSAQKAMAENIEHDLQNHPWEDCSCNGSKSFEEYDFYEMNHMFEEDEKFDFDATVATLSYAYATEFVSYHISERIVLGQTPYKEMYILTETEGEHTYTELFTSREEARARLRDRYHETAVLGDPDAIEKADYSDDVASLIPKEGDSINWRITEHKIESEDKRKWDFKYEQEVWDHAGTNLVGVLTNGEKFLFFHVFRDDEDKPLLCHIYNSILMFPETEECSYGWTAENDSLVIEALNNCSPERICGENSVLREIEFNKGVQLVGFFEPMFSELHEAKRPEWGKMLSLSPDEIVKKMEADNDENYPFNFGGEDAGETQCEWLSEDEYSIGDAFLENGGRKEYTSDGRYLVCYEPAEQRIEIYNYHN